MSERVTMPALGESVTEGTVTRWLKNVGDSVAIDERLLEVSTDKVDTEIPSPVAGTLQEILVAEDETVPVGTDLAVVGSDTPSPAGSAAPAAEPVPEADAPAAEPVPEADAPAAEPVPEADAPAAEPVPEADAPAAEPVPEADAPAAEPVPEADAPAAEPVPEADAPAAEPVPEADAPAAEPVPEADAPAAEPVPEADAPAAEPVPEADAPAAEPVPEAAAATPVAQTPAQAPPGPDTQIEGGTTVTMPALGESVTEGTVTRWLKAEGDQVEVDEPLLEVSTDKVDTEIPSPVAGTLTKILVGEDETVAVGRSE